MAALMCWLCGLRGVAFDLTFVRHSGRLGEQAWHADEIVCGHRERELESDAREAAQLHLGEPGDGLGPAERFLDELALPQAHGIARVSRRASVNGGRSGLLCDMRSWSAPLRVDRSELRN